MAVRNLPKTFSRDLARVNRNGGRSFEPKMRIALLITVFFTAFQPVFAAKHSVAVG
jgi:hypothetical protein